MKRQLLSFVAFAALALTAGAAVEPTYTTTGSVGKVEYYETDENDPVNTTFPEAKDLPVEVYGTDSIIIRNWCGAKGYDICVTCDAEGYATAAWRQIDGVACPDKDGYNYYVETGLDAPNPVVMKAYMESGWCFAYSDEETKSGYVALFGYTYDDILLQNKTWTYYYIGWGDCEPDTSEGGTTAGPTYTTTGSVGQVESFETDEEYSVHTTFPEAKDLPVEVYGTDSIVVRNWCGVEGYDICVTRDADGNATGAWRQIDGVAQPNFEGYYYNVETGLQSPNPVLMQAYLDEGYGYAYSDDETKSGFVELFCYTYDNLAYENGQWTYYYLGWGDWEPSSTEGISAPITVFSDKNAPVYNLAGQKVGSGYKGVVIQNGKKFIRK